MSAAPTPSWTRALGFHSAARSFAAIFVATFVTAAGVAALAWWALSPDRGLDLTDEGLYLLAADPPAKGASWGWPFGWNTGLLYDLTGHQIALFRLAGAVLLAMMFAAFGYFAVRGAYASGGGRSGGFRYGLLGTGIGFFGAAFYYAGFHRTPSYNWLNLIAMLVALIGVLCAARQNPGRSARHGVILPAALISLGFLLAFPAKPTTPFFLALSVLPFLLVSIGLRRVLALAAAVIVVTSFWVALVVVAGLWPFESLRIFYDSLSAPALASSQSLRGAFYEFTFLPSRLVGEVRAQPTRIDPIAAIGLAAALIGLIPRKPLTWLVALGFAGILGTALEVAMVGLPNPFDAAPVFRWNFPPIVTAMWIVVACSVVMVTVRAVVSLLWVQRFDSGVARSAFLAFAILCQPLIFGFGSAHGLYNQGFLAAGFFPLVAIVLFVTLAGRRASVWLGALLLVFVVVLATVTIRDSRMIPIRIASMAQSTEAVDLGERGGLIRVDPGLADLISTLDREMKAAGWEANTPMIGLGWHWSATIPYVLGARTPNTLMITIYGMPGSLALAEHNVRVGLKGFEAQSAWLMLSSPRVLDYGAEREVAATLSALKEKTGREFPADYLCVAEVGQIQVWKPSSSTESSQRSAGCGTSTPAGSEYSLMWGYTGNLSY